ncbi:hypothetical protein AB0C59_10125 [Streptomyces sp. NPDC048664]|uniref:hypothetical protein n=1 Tax=Streptomyces sp. NPDC048664 TaxID=3154505 RepID=UPI0034297222
MSGTSLSAQLLRMGWAAGRRTGDGAVRAVALLLAAASLALGLSAVAAVCAAYDGMERRTGERALQFQDAFPDRPAVALARSDFDEVEGRQYSLVYLRPLSTDTPLPPGIDRWPAPGQAVLSPQLDQALRAEGAPSRLGRVVGFIHQSGLAGPGERYAYVNPTDKQFDKAGFSRVVGFGKERGLPAGDVLFVSGRGKLLTALYLILLPAGVLAVVAARMGSAGRDKRTALISALGGGSRHRLALTLGESAVPVLAGAVLGALPAFLVMTTDHVRLPWIGYWLSGADLRHWWWGAALAGCVGAIGTLVLVGVMHRPGGRGGTRPVQLSARRGRAIRWAALACPLLIFATVRGPALLDPAQYADLRMKLYNAGVVAVMATFPCAVALGAGAAGSRIADSVRRTGSSGALVSGRRMAAHPGVTARLVAGVGIAMVLVSQVQLKTSQFGASAQAAQETARRIGHSVVLLQVDPSRLSPNQLAGALRRLPENTESFALYPPTGPASDGLPRVQAPCPALRSVKLPCSRQVTTTGTALATPRIAEAVRWSLPTDERIAVQEGDVLPGDMKKAPSNLVLTSSDGRDMDYDQIKRLFRDDLPVAAVTAELPGEGWLVGARNGAAHGRWVTFLGVPGLLIVAVAATLGNLAEFLRLSLLLAPLSVLTGRRRIYYSASAWALLAPLLAATAAGVVVAAWLATPQESPVDGIGLSGGTLSVTAGALAVLAVLTWWWGARAALRQTAQWRPYGD